MKITNRRKHYYEDVLTRFPGVNNLRYLIEYDQFMNATAIHCVLFQRKGHRGLHQIRSFNSFNDNLLNRCFDSKGDERYDLQYEMTGITPDDIVYGSNLPTIIHDDVWNFYTHIGYDHKNRTLKHLKKFVISVDRTDTI